MATPISMSASTANFDDKVAQRESAVKKKEKELTQRAQDLDRRKTLLEETEEKHGALATREAAVDAKEKDAAGQMKEIKRREKAVKDGEQRVAESSAAVEMAETRVTQREVDVEARLKEADRREGQLARTSKELDLREEALNKRHSQLQDVALEQEQRKTTLNREKEVLNLKASDVAAAEVAVNAMTKEVQKKAEAADRAHAANREKTLQLQTLEGQISKERDQVLVQARSVAVDEKLMAAKRRELDTIAADCDKRVAICEAQEAGARKKKEEAQASITELALMKEHLDRRRQDLDAREDGLQRLQVVCRSSEASVARRENTLSNEFKEVRAREKALLQKQTTLEELAADLEEKTRLVRDREDAVGVREMTVADREVAMDKLHTQCVSDMAATQRRQEALDAKERDLVAWMKEMQWREMMLGEHEGVVHRQPVTPIVAVSKRAVPAGTNEDAAPTLGGKHATGGANASSSHNSGPFPEGFGHRAFGHAVVALQFRRLKDQYVSAQMKHARTELQDHEDLARAVTERRKRQPRAGILVSQPEGDLSEQAEMEGGLQELTKEVHRMSVRFLRSIAKLRAFDGFESPTSLEKLQELARFTAAEQSVLTTTTNMEYILRSLQAFMRSLQSSPLDHKDRAVDVQDLVNRTSRWWARTKEAVTSTLQQLLTDRQRFLTQGLAVLDKHGIDASRRTDGAEQPSGTTEKEHWPYGNALLPPKLQDGVERYDADSAYDHVKESAILAPRGLATLRAVSDAKGASSSGGPVVDGVVSPPRGVSPAQSRAQTPAAIHRGGSNVASVLAPSLKTPERPDSRAGVFRSTQETKAEECLMDLGRNFATPPHASSSRPPSAPHHGEFNLGKFLTSPDTKPKLQHSSPYAVPPVRPLTALGNSSPSKAKSSSGSAATPKSKTPLGKRLGLPPSAPTGGRPATAPAADE
jgi:hypothetical protein